jgi:L-lactate dehydrogenase complex protein LldF
MSATDFPTLARAAMGQTQMRHNVRKATTTIRARTARVTAELPDWEQLRQAGQAIKAETMRHLDTHLRRLEETRPKRAISSSRSRRGTAPRARSRSSP